MNVEVVVETGVTRQEGSESGGIASSASRSFIVGSRRGAIMDITAGSSSDRSTKQKQSRKKGQRTRKEYPVVLENRLDCLFLVRFV